MSETQSEEKQEILDKQQGTEEQRVLKQDIERAEAKVSKRITAEIMRSEEFSGPIPHPEILKSYEEAFPGSADRIFRMAEKQSEHRQELEKCMVQAESRDSLLGIISALLLGVGCLIAGVLIVSLAPSSASAIGGSLLGMTGMGSIILSFLNRTHGSERKKATEDSPKKQQDSNDT